MQQINFYQTTQILKDKTIFSLIEKCYLSGSRVVVLTRDLETTQIIDKLLWIFSQKKFIPHGTENDEYPAKQPVYISHLLKNPNHAQTLVIITPDLTNIEVKQLETFEKILIIHEKVITHSDDQQFFVLFENDKTAINYYVQNDNGSWQAK